MIDGQNFFDQSIRNDLTIYDKIQKISTGQRDDYATGCLLDYLYFKEHFQLIGIDLSKKRAFDADLKSIQQINSTGNLDRAGNTRIFFIIKEAK